MVLAPCPGHLVGPAEEPEGAQRKTEPLAASGNSTQPVVAEPPARGERAGRTRTLTAASCRPFAGVQYA